MSDHTPDSVASSLSLHHREMKSSSNGHPDYGEQTTTVDGEGASPGRKDLLAVGIATGLGKRYCEEAADEIQETVRERLGKYL